LTIQVCQIQIRQGSAVQWIFANPVLLQGEFGLETDSRRVKLGNGVTAWNDLNTFPQVIGSRGVGSRFGPPNSVIAPTLNVVGDDPDAAGNVYFWSGNFNAFGRSGNWFRYLACGNVINAPADITAGQQFFNFDMNGFSTAGDNYFFSANFVCETTDIPGPLSEIPSQFRFDFTGPSPAYAFCQILFNGLVGNPAIQMTGTFGNVILSPLGNGQLQIVDPATLLFGDLVVEDLGCGGTGDADAQLDLQATDRGFLANRLTTAERLAIGGPPEPLLVYDTDKGRFRVFRQADWRDIQGYPIFSGAKISHTAPFLIPSGALATVVQWDSVLFDSDAYFQPLVNNTRFIIPFDGFYQVGFDLSVTPTFPNVQIQAQLTSSAFDVDVVDNRHNIFANERITPRGSAIAFLLAGQTVQLAIRQQTGVSLDFAVGGPGVFISPIMWIQQIGTTP